MSLPVRPGHWPRVLRLRRTRSAREHAYVVVEPVEGAPALDGSDCVTCGRCCHHGPRTVHLLEADEARIEARAGKRVLEQYTELHPPYFRFVKNTGERCACLDVSVPGRYPCAIYEVRPEDCRIVDAGSKACLEARRLGHLPDSVADADFKLR